MAFVLQLIALRTKARAAKKVSHFGRSLLVRALARRRPSPSLFPSLHLALAAMAVVPPDSLALIASLLQSDLAELRQQHAHDPQATAASDEDDAFALYEQELAGLVQAEQDDQVARSLAAAAVTDGPLLQALAREEEAARQDRALALQLSTDIDEDGDDELMPQDYYDRAGEAVAPPQGLDPTPVASTSNSSSSPIQQRSECVACTDTFLSSDLIRAPCKHGHPYCGGCLHDLFVAATKDESLFPPRCETVQIPLDLVKPHLSPQELFEYQRSAIEFRTPNRLYCSTTTCSAFLGSASGTRTAIECRTCRRSTCAACKTPWHGLFGPCGVSPEDEAVQALERDFEYKQCPSCKRVVELESGCHHMCVDVPLHSTLSCALEGSR